MTKFSQKPMRLRQFDPLPVAILVAILSFLDRSRRVVSEQKKSQKSQKINKYLKNGPFFSEYTPQKKHSYMAPT